MNLSNFSFNLPDPPPPFQKKLDLAKMNKKVRKEKAVPVPPGIALKPPGFFFPLPEVRPLIEPTPAPVVFIGNVLQADIDEKAKAKKALADAKARENAKTQGDAKEQETVQPKEDKQSKKSKKSKKAEKEEEEKKEKEKKEKEKKIRPEYPMTQYRDRDDHPTYNGHFLHLQKIRGNIRVVGPEYCFGLADNNLEVDYEGPRAPPRPITPPLCTQYPIMPVSPREGETPLQSFDSPVPDDRMVDVGDYPWSTQSTPVSGFCAPSAPSTPSKTQRKGPPALRDVIKPVLYSDFPPEKRGDYIPPPPDDRHARLREKLIKEKEQRRAREAEREAERKARQPSETSADSSSISSFPPTSVSSNLSQPEVWPYIPRDDGLDANGYYDSYKPFTPFSKPAPDRVWPSEADFPPPRIWTKPEKPRSDNKPQHGIPSAAIFKGPEYNKYTASAAGSQTTKVFNIAGPMDASKLMLGSEARLRDGPSSHRAVVESSPSLMSSNEPEYPNTITPPRIPRPPQATHTRTSSRRAIYFTPDQILGSPPSSPSANPPTPPPKDWPGLRQIPPYSNSRCQARAPTPDRAASGRPGPTPLFPTVLPLKVHKRNASNPVPQSSRTVFDYASVTTSRAGPKPQGPPPVLRHRARMESLTNRPNRLESLPINVKSNARPSTSTMKFRTNTDGEIRPGHNRSASEFGQLNTQSSLHNSKHRNVETRPDHNRSASDFGHFQPMQTSLRGRPDMGRSQSPSLSTPNYPTKPSVSSTTNGRHIGASRPGHSRMTSEAGYCQPNAAAYAERSLSYRSNTTTGLENRSNWI
ncbi:hypothetical protein CVT25_015882 [Psilocybe cyanescens]|uniref:Uncharacterized protein n=1 Tax=Psilocybe cyanescens TaxID=93625 RepID=A0A409XIJ8_PSICY|nr:hypothetical protein CVT25_015882 [Psilocybe cyanescens]